MREAAVDPLVDAREPGGDLVDDSVQVVDASLQGDREVDEVVLSRAPRRTSWAFRTARSLR